jgi:hypothetical protein
MLHDGLHDWRSLPWELGYRMDWRELDNSDLGTTPGNKTIGDRTWNLVNDGFLDNLNIVNDEGIVFDATTKSAGFSNSNHSNMPFLEITPNDLILSETLTYKSPILVELMITRNDANDNEGVGLAYASDANQFAFAVGSSYNTDQDLIGYRNQAAALSYDVKPTNTNDCLMLIFLGLEMRFLWGTSVGGDFPPWSAYTTDNGEFTSWNIGVPTTHPVQDPKLYLYQETYNTDGTFQGKFEAIKAWTLPGFEVS